MVHIDTAGSNAGATAVASADGNAGATAFATASQKGGVNPPNPPLSSSGQRSVSSPTTVTGSSFSTAASPTSSTESDTAIASTPSLLSSSSTQPVSPSPSVLTSSTSISSQVTVSLPSSVSIPTESSVFASSISTSSQVTLSLSPSISTPTESSGSGPTSSAQRVVPARLSTADRAGIIIVATVLSLAFIVGWSYFLRRRKKLRSIEAKDSNNRSPFRWLSNKSGPHELDTKSNIPEVDGRDKAHELITKHNVPELDSRAKRPKAFTRGINMMSPGSRHELETQLAAPVFRTNNEQYTHENSSVNHEPNETKLRLLQGRIEGIREEQARLERLQYLKVLEEETKQEILKAHKTSATIK